MKIISSNIKELIGFSNAFNSQWVGVTINHDTLKTSMFKKLKIVSGLNTNTWSQYMLISLHEKRLPD